MDAMGDYLPNPGEANMVKLLDSNKKIVMNNLEKSKNIVHESSKSNLKHEKLIAFVFKVQHDHNRGPLVFVRIYTGKLFPNTIYYNLCKNSNNAKLKKERVTQLMRAYADTYVDIDSIGEGDIGILIGCKSVKTGDTLSNVYDTSLALYSIEIPQPVFSASLELESSADEKKLENALSILTRDDPSLVVTNDRETGQQILSGLGELHLDIALSKLQRTFKISCEYSKVRVAYHETFSGTIVISGEYSSVESYNTKKNSGRNFISKKNMVNSSESTVVTLKISPNILGINSPNIVTLNGSVLTYAKDMYNNPKNSKKGLTYQNCIPEIYFMNNNKQPESKCKLSQDQLNGLLSGILDTIMYSGKYGYPLQGIEIEILPNESYINNSVKPESVKAAAIIAIRELKNNFDKIKPCLLEPQAIALINVPSIYIGAVVGNITNCRRGIVQEISLDTNNSFRGSFERSIIKSSIPLEGLLDYSTTLRTLTSGEGYFSTSLDGYVILNESDTNKILNNY